MGGAEGPQGVGGAFGGAFIRGLLAQAAPPGDGVAMPAPVDTATVSGAPKPDAALQTPKAPIYDLGRWFKEAILNGDEIKKDDPYKGVKGTRVTAGTATGFAIKEVPVEQEITLVFSIPKDQREGFDPAKLAFRAFVPNYRSGQIIEEVMPGVEFGTPSYNAAKGELRVTVKVTKASPDKPIVIGQVGGPGFATLYVGAAPAAGAPATATGGQAPAADTPAPAGTGSPRPKTRPVEKPAPAPQSGSVEGFGSGKD